jgi:hypothetical protein
LLPPVIECDFVDFAVNESVTAIQGEVQCGIANRLTITHAMDENGAWGTRQRPLMRIVVTSVNDRRLAKTRLSSAIPNTAVIAGAIAAIMFGSTDTTRAQIPHINIEETCRAAARAMVGLMGGSTTEQDVNACLDSEQKAREQIIKDQATYSSTDKGRCMRTKVYLPSYVEWLTCLEMERDVRKMRLGEPPATETMTLPRVRPAISY